MQSLDYRALADVPAAAIEALLDRAFGADRHGRTAYRLRAGARPVPDLSFVLVEEDGALAGVLQSWPVALRTADGEIAPLILVGPVAVAPARQGAGLGHAMMERMLDAARGREPLVLIGDPGYYGRFFGFSAEATAGWMLPGPVERHRLLALAGQHRLPLRGALGPRG